MARFSVPALVVLFALGCSTREDETPTPALDAGHDGGFALDFSYDTTYVDGDIPDGACAFTRVETTKTTPNVILIIDQSGSMIMDFDGDASRWSVLRDALISMPDGLIPSLQENVRFGAVMYTDDPEIGPGCPDTASTPAVLNAYSSIGSLYASNSPAGNTPTGDTIAGVLASIDTLAPTHEEDRTILILATDGEPATCENSTDVEGGRALVLDQVEAAHTMGIDTFVISVGVGIAVEHLQQVANAGAGHTTGPDAPFWVATNTAGLQGALSTIVGGVLSCNLLLAGRIEPAFACEGVVTLGDDELECGTEWRPVDTNHIELLGDACDRLFTTTDDLVATFPCNALL